MSTHNLTKPERLRLVCANICRYANGECLCFDRDKKSMCKGPLDKAVFVYDLAREPEAVVKVKRK